MDRKEKQGSNGRKKNCWEVKGCGRGPRSAVTNQTGGKAPAGVCPAALETRLDGIHDGANGGRSCWVVVGTMCNGEIQGTFARKYATCGDCDFYRSLKDEEAAGFQLTFHLLQKLEK